MCLALVVGLVAVACSTSAASADVPVVSATSYPGAAGSVGTRSVTVQTLDGCPLYSGGNPITMMPSGMSQPLPTTTWSLETVITCGLQIPITGVNYVQVARANGSFDEPLSNGDIIDPGRYHDPNAEDVLPVVAVNAGSGQNTYFRPFRGGSDQNSSDEVTDNGPITISVWVNAQPLRVTIHTHRVPGSKALQLSATVQTSDRATVPISALKWHWTFQDDGSNSIKPSPVHTSGEASYNVTLQVTSQGTAGTATTLVTSPTKAAPGKRNESGGHKQTNSQSPTGKDNGGSNQKPGTGGHSSNGSSPKAGGNQQQTQPSSPATTPSTPTTPTPTAPSATTPATNPAVTTPRSTPAPRPPKRTNRQKPLSTGTGPLVTGRLIADLTPLPERSSPLVRATASAAPVPAVRQATSTGTSPLAPIVASAVAAALLGLGAWHELRGSRRSLTGPSST